MWREMCMTIDARGIDFQTLNQRLRDVLPGKATVMNCLGQRFIASGMRDVSLTIEGTPGNALGCFLDSGTIEVMGNAQDAVGDTMSGGTIVIHGSCGDALGYSMRGGQIYVQGDVGYRVGIHMKQHDSMEPCIVIGGRAGRFLGEYQAGGTILVLGIGHEKEAPVGAFCGAGMHGGKIYLRSTHQPALLPKQVKIRPPQNEETEEIHALIHAFCHHFGAAEKMLLSSSFWCLSPDDQNPYHRMYTQN